MIYNVLWLDWNLHIKNVTNPTNGFEKGSKRFYSNWLRSSQWLSYQVLILVIRSPTHWDFLSTSDSDYQVETTLVFQGPKHKSSIYLFLNKFNKFTETTSSYTEKTAPPIIIHSTRNWNLEQFLNIWNITVFGVVGFAISTKYLRRFSLLSKYDCQ